MCTVLPLPLVSEAVLANQAVRCQVDASLGRPPLQSTLTHKNVGLDANAKDGWSKSAAKIL